MTTETLIERLLASPVGRKLKQEEVAERQADRQSHIAASAAIENAAIAKMPGLLVARNDAQARREAAAAALKVAEQEFNLAFAQHQAASSRFGSELESHRRELELSAAPMIDSFLERLAGELSRLQELPAETTRSVSQAVRSYGEILVHSNREKIVARIRACIAARDTVTALKYQPLEGAELAARLAEIWDALPPTNLETK